MADDDSAPGPLDRPEHADDRTTPQDIVDSLVDRKGLDTVRENFEQLTAPATIMRIDTDCDDVEVREP